MIDHKLNILVVDDNAGIRYLLSTVIQEEGHHCLTAVNGLEGLKLAKEHEPDLLFVDLKMPCMNGINLINHLFKISDHFKIIIITAYLEAEVKQQLLTNRAINYIVKPFDLNDIRKIIKEVALNCSKHFAV